MLIIHPKGDNFEQTVDVMKEELQTEFRIKTFITSGKTKQKQFAEQIRTANPDIIVLANNPNVARYKIYQSELPENKAKIPAIAIMGAYLPTTVEGIKNITGISYEVPVVTGVVNYRNLFNTTIKKNRLP